MYLFITTIVAILLHVSIAAPAYPRQCKPDECYHAVFGGPPACPTALVDAKRDCASLFQTIVTPCPVTSAHTITKTYTAKPMTITAIQTKFSGKLETATDHVTSVRATKVTTTIDISTTHTVVDTMTDLETVTSFTTVVDATTEIVTVTSTTIVATVDYTPQLPKRGLDARGYARCSPVTSTTTDIPSYAECCHGYSAYASACSCLGAIHHTETLPAKTVGSSVTVRETVTPKFTDHVTTTVKGSKHTTTITDVITIPTTELIKTTATVTAYATLTSAITDTVAITESSTSFTGTTTTDTVVVSATASACPLMEIEGPNAGQYLAVDSANEDALHWTHVLSDAFDFYLDSQSQLATDGRLVLAIPDQLSAVFLQGFYSPGDQGLVTLICSFDISNVLSCTASGGMSNLFMSNNVALYSQYLAMGQASDATTNGYSIIKIISTCQGIIA